MAQKATTVKEAIQKFEEKYQVKASEEEFVRLYGQYPPIEKLDASLSQLTSCTKLSLSSNCIDKVGNLNALKNLKILSLGRNNIKNLGGFESVGDVLEQLWLSYNLIEKLKGLAPLKKLKILYLSNNYVKDFGEVNKLNELISLEDLILVGNPIEEKDPEAYREEIIKRCPKLKKLDGIPIVREGEDDE